MCLFCKIANHEIPSDIVYEDDKIIVFKDINPKAKIHILFVPKNHIETLNDINTENSQEVSYIFEKIPEIAKKLEVAEQGYRIVGNCNEYGGQEVFHLHFHLLAGEKLSGF